MRVLIALGAAVGCLVAPVSAGGGDMFTIGLEEPVSDGVPGPGAGNIETSGEEDIYTFTVAANTLVFFDELSGGCNIRWMCEDPLDGLVFLDNAMCSGDPGSLLLTMAGDYTITVFGNAGATGTYGFTLWEVNPDDEFALTLKQVVSDGVPGAGAGNIEEPGTRDIYTFTVSPGTEVFFDEMGGPCGVRWQCTDSTAAVVFTDNAFCSGDPGAHTLDLGGTYTLTVFGNGDATGSYSFVTWAVNPTEEFMIGLEETVSDGVPAAGAGNIEEPGTMDVYTFTADPGTVVFFDEMGGPCGVRWMCTDSTDTVVFTDNAFCSSDPGTKTLDLGGTYTLTVYGNGDATGTYAFIIWEVDPTQAFAIGLEETVSDGVPGPGAGNIEEPGTMDVYTFTAALGTLVYFDELSGPCGLHWKCEDSNGAEVFSDNAYCAVDPGPITLETGGEYTITVYGAGDATGPYSFIIFELAPPDVFGITLDEVVSDGIPGAGAGNLEEPGVFDIYMLEVVEPVEVCFEELGAPCGFNWTCVDPTDQEVFFDNAMCAVNPGRYGLNVPGTYSIRVNSPTGATGTYSLIVNTATLADFVGDCGVDVSDLLFLLGAWGTPAADLTGDDNTDVQDLLTLLGQWG